jgi:hypothetical protein
MKSYRFYGDEMEVLGQRLDAARKASINAKTPWSKQYWDNAVERLVFQWRQLPVLHDAEAQVTIIPRWTVDYNFYEKNLHAVGNGVTDRAYHKLFRESIDLDASWENHRAARLAKAQF